MFLGSSESYVIAIRRLIALVLVYEVIAFRIVCIVVRRLDTGLNRERRTGAAKYRGLVYATIRVPDGNSLSVELDARCQLIARDTTGVSHPQLLHASEDCRPQLLIQASVDHGSLLALESVTTELQHATVLSHGPNDLVRCAVWNGRIDFKRDRNFGAHLAY